MPAQAQHALRDAQFVLGLHVHGTGLGWSPHDVAALPWSEIKYHCEQVGSLWDKMNPSTS